MIPLQEHNTGSWEPVPLPALRGYVRSMNYLPVRASLLVMLIALALAMSITGSAAEAPPAWNPAVSVDSSSTFSSGTSGEDWQGRVYVTTRADGVKVAVWRVASGHNTNDAELWIAFRDPVTGTWTDPNETLDGSPVDGFPMTPPVGNISYGEGVPLTAPNGDLLIEMWSVTGVSPTGTLNGTYQSRSTDGGETWSDPVAVTFAGNPHADTDTFMSDQWFVVDGTIYMGARYYAEGDGAPSASELMKSTDQGASWSYVSTIQGTAEGGSGGQEVGLVYLGRGEILAMLRDNPHTHSYQRRSLDYGLTWGTLDDVTSSVGIAGRQKVYTLSQLMGLPAAHEDPRLVMVGFIHTSSGDSMPRRNAVWFSPDRGATWSAPFYIDSETTDAGYGDLYWDDIALRIVALNYQGSTSAASVKQYNLEVTGVGLPAAA